MAALPLLTIVAPPFWAGLADRLRARAKVLSLVLLGAATGCSAFLAIQGIWSGLAVILLYGFFRSPVITLTDALTHAMIYPNLERFGMIRLWGSVGFIFGSVSIGQLRTLLPDSATQLISAAFLVVAALLVRGYEDPVEKEAPSQDVAQSNMWRRGLKFMLQPTALLIALGNLFHAMGHSSFDAYFALFAQEHEVGDHIIGFGWGIGVTAEVIIMRLAPSILKHYRPSIFLMLGAGAAAFRWGMMYYLNDPIGSLWLQPLHALTFGLWYLLILKLATESSSLRYPGNLPRILLGCHELRNGERKLYRWPSHHCPGCTKRLRCRRHPGTLGLQPLRRQSFLPWS